MAPERAPHKALAAQIDRSSDRAVFRQIADVRAYDGSGRRLGELRLLAR